jgi:glycosyltransferase involved in cell wall biosynthesis
MVGMHLTRTRGGISTLTSSILNSRLRDDFDIKYIASQAEDLGKSWKLLLAGGAVFRFLISCVFTPPEIVYVHIGSNASLYRESAFILLARMLRRRVIAHFHAGDLELYVAQQPEIGQKFISYSIGLSDKVIAVSRESARQLKRLTLHPRISVLPNAIDTKELCSIERRPKKNKGDAVRLLFVGAVGKLKGERDLIKALALLRERGVNLKVDLVGFGAEKLAAYCSEAGVSHFIDHLGPVSMVERSDFFRRADIFVLPTYAEAMPISVIEAMAAGLAIVTTPVGGIPELIEDGKEGSLVAVGHAGGLAEKIVYLAKDGKARRRFGENARRKAVEQLDFARYIDALGTELKSVDRETAIS